MKGREFPGGPVVRTLSFQYRGMGLIPALGTKVLKQHGQINKDIKNEKKMEGNCIIQYNWVKELKDVILFADSLAVWPMVADRFTTISLFIYTPALGSKSLRRLCYQVSWYTDNMGLLIP